MTIARRAVSMTGAVLMASAVAAAVRSHEEYLRRTGRAGTRVMVGPDGREVEFMVNDLPADRPVILFESGLGSPLESWDWVARDLAGDFRTLRYHRPGYGRTRSRAMSSAVVEQLLRSQAPLGPVLITAHSIGALVAASVLRDSQYVRERCIGVLLVDGTDAVLMRASRESRRSRGDYLQMTIQEMLASVTGLGALTVSKIERDVAYVPDVQRAYMTFSTSPRTLLTALREHRCEPAADDFGGVTPHVLSASDNTVQQRAFAERIGATYRTVPDSAHRSIIGRLECANVVATRVRELAS